MTQYQTLASIYYLPYPALDAAVADLVENITVATPDGQIVPLTWEWMQLSAGSSQHRVTDETGREVLRVRVRLLPEENTIVSVVNFQTMVPEWSSFLNELAGNLHKIIQQHRANLAQLENDGIARRAGAKIDAERIKANVSTNAPVPPQRPGRRADPVNAWARQQLALGVAREQVYQEWARRKSLDISTEDNDGRARAAFRKALQRSRQ